jgi:mono/diheme cytochrome c family protein
MTRSSDPTTVIRMILRGARSVATAAEPTTPGMPSFGWQLDDVQVAAVATYIRNAWGSAAAPVSAADVSGARSELQGRAD